MCIFGVQNERSLFIMKIKYQKPLVTFHSIHIKLNCEQENDMEPKKYSWNKRISVELHTN